MIMAVLLKVAQRDAYIGFGIWMVLVVSFMMYSNYVVDCDDIEFKLKSKNKEKQYNKANLMRKRRNSTIMMLDTR